MCVTLQHIQPPGCSTQSSVPSIRWKIFPISSWLKTIAKLGSKGCRTHCGSTLFLANSIMKADILIRSMLIKIQLIRPLGTSRFYMTFSFFKAIAWVLASLCIHRCILKPSWSVTDAKPILTHPSPIIVPGRIPLQVTKQYAACWQMSHHTRPNTQNCATAVVTTLRNRGRRSRRASMLNYKRLHKSYSSLLAHVLRPWR